MTRPSSVRVEDELLKFLEYVYNQKELVLADEYDIVTLDAVPDLIRDYVLSPYFTQREET